SASIIIQLLTVVHPTLAEIKKEGESGRRKISKYTRYGTLVLAIFQSIGIATGLPNMPGMQGLVINPGFAFYFTAVVSLVTGTMFLMWLGEQITERGIGNRSEERRVGKEGGGGRGPRWWERRRQGR